MFLNGSARIHGRERGGGTSWNKLDFACFKKCIFIIQEVVSPVSSQLQFSSLQRSPVSQNVKLLELVFGPQNLKWRRSYALFNRCKNTLVDSSRIDRIPPVITSVM